MLSPINFFLNRELSQLAFQQRVLAQAEDADVPLLERLRYLCIVSSNLDEFFEIRVGGMYAQIKESPSSNAVKSVEARQLLQEISKQVHGLVAQQYQLFNEQILPALAVEGIRLLRHTDRTSEQQAWVAEYFHREVKPLLTPIGLDPAHPFPQVSNKSLHFVVELGGRDAFGRSTSIAIVKAPRVLPRVILLPHELSEGGTCFILLSSVIRAHMEELFSGRSIVGYSQFRVTRNSDLWLDEEEVKNLRQALRGELPQRQFGSAVRLEVAASCPDHLAQFLLQQFVLAADDLYRVEGPVNLVRLSQILALVDRPELRFSAFTPGVPARLRNQADIYAAIRQHDILLHHPFQSFQPVIDFIRQAAVDPNVVAIKQTVYRTGVNSVLMEALIEAARHGKEVTVVVELMARFDEEANINWAERLEEVGAQVVYGVVGLKTHAKMALIIRREEGALRYYAHLGTGNYHPATTKVYTDFGLLTAHPEICNDVSEVFLHLTSLAKAKKLQHLLLAPFTLHRRLIQAIRQEMVHAKEGRKAHIIAKMNALLDEAVIKALYEASIAGVEIDLIVRGACALRPQVPGLSERIRVRSIVGRFLEHSRVYYFYNDGVEDVYLASADWMGRNLFRRIEIAFPLLDAKLKERVIEEGLRPYLSDNQQTWELLPDGQYRLVNSKRAKKKINAQMHLMVELGQG